MNAFSLISMLKLCSVIAGALAILCLVPIILILTNSTPEQLKEVIEAEKFRNDPRHRKATQWLSPEDQDKLESLLGCPDVSAITGWIGHYPGMEKL